MGKTLTVKVTFDKKFSLKIADRMRRNGYAKVVYQVPMLDDELNEVGSVCTFTGDPAALWLLGKMFQKETEAQPFAIRGLRLV